MRLLLTMMNKYDMVSPTMKNKNINRGKNKMAIVEGTAYWASITRPNEKFEPMGGLIYQYQIRMLTNLKAKVSMLKSLL